MQPNKAAPASPEAIADAGITLFVHQEAFAKAAARAATFPLHLPAYATGCRTC